MATARFHAFLAVSIIALAASPALAGTISPAPAPIAGLGVGAFALLAIGYRKLKNITKR